MEKTSALDALSALSQPMRLDVFRLLVRAGAKGLTAGEIARALSARPNTLSANLSVLSQAGLVRSAREGRAIRYFSRPETLGDLLGFLLEDCCGGRPETCRPLIETALRACQDA